MDSEPAVPELMLTKKMLMNGNRLHKEQKLFVRTLGHLGMWIQKQARNKRIDASKILPQTVARETNRKPRLHIKPTAA